MILRSLVQQCERVLEPHRLQLTERGRVLSTALVGFRRPAEAEPNPLHRTTVVVGHDPEARALWAHLYGQALARDVAWRQTYDSAADIPAASQAVVRQIADWVAAPA